MEKDYVKFPKLSQNATNFPNSMGPRPIPKKGCESPVNVPILQGPLTLWYSDFAYFSECSQNIHILKIHWYPLEKDLS